MNGALQGMGVVITRPRAEAERLAADLRREGAIAFVFPALAIETLASTPALEAALDRLSSASLAIFVSAHAVAEGLAAWRRRSRPWPEETRVAAVGEATASALRNSGFDAVISPPERHDSEGLLALEELGDVEDREVVIFRGQGGREQLKETLEARGARVAYAECYRRVRPHGDATELLRAWSRGEVHAVSVLSAETLENFVAMLGADNRERLREVTLVAGHSAIAGHREARAFARVVVAEHGPRGIVQALAPLRVPP